MMPLAMFGSRSFIGLTLLTLLLYGALGALMVLIPTVLIDGSGLPARPPGGQRAGAGGDQSWRWLHH